MDAPQHRSACSSEPVDGDLEPTDDDRLVTAVLTASRALVGVSARSLADVEDRVTLAQFRLLVVLERTPRVRLTELAERLEVQPSTAVRMVDRLVEAGLVTRVQNPHNRREVHLDLTEQGVELVRTVTRRRRAEIHEIIATIPPHRRPAVTEALSAFAAAAGEAEPPGRSAEQVGW